MGDLNSPPIAECSMRKVAASGKENYPYAYETLMNKRYMDDIMDSASSKDEITKKRDETELLGKYGFEIKKLYSNNSNLGVLDKDQKVIEMGWNMEKHDLSIVIAANKKADQNELRKREVLSSMVSIWDPLGLCSGFVVKGRLISQSIVRLKLKWDVPIRDSELEKKWNAWKEQLPLCEEMIIGRSILPDYPGRFNTTYQLVDVKFLGAKDLVGPIGGNTVPRQELCGALILSRLTDSDECYQTY